MQTQKKWLFFVLSCIGMMGTMSSTKAAVTVFWEQDGADVIASWSGTFVGATWLFPGNNNTRQEGTTNGDSWDVARATQLGHYVDTVGNGYYIAQASGQATITALVDTIEFPVSGESHASFGFSSGDMHYNDVHISGGTIDEVTQLSFDPTRDVIRFSNTTLATMGADSFDNTLAWTAWITGDTISYNTGPVPVPEPSSAVLLGLGTIGLLSRRKR